MRAVIIISSVLAAFLFSRISAAPDKVMCYYGSWAGNRSGNGTFTVDNIKPELCTHLIYSFVGLKKNGSIKVPRAWHDLKGKAGLGGFKQFNNLTKQALGVKTLVAISGWSMKVLRNNSLRATLVQNLVEFGQKYKFDGVDLGLKYLRRSGRSSDIKNFSKLIKELRAAFDPHGLLLTASVAAAESAIKSHYEVPEFSKYLDFINVFAFDMHGPWHGKTGISAPLYARSNDSNPELNVKASIEAWINLGADPKKLILGMATYGRSFTLADSNKHGVGAKTTGHGKPGKYTKEAGILGYNEIVEMLQDGQLTQQWEDQQQVPYAYKGNQWVGYDNEKSIKLKCDFAKEKNLGGGLIWSIDTDDFRGVSGKKYALLQTINKVFGRSV